MAKKKTNVPDHKATPKMRTYTLSSAVWEAAKKYAGKEETSAARVLDVAVESEIKQLEKDLKALGLDASNHPDKRVRLPMTRNLLDRLGEARDRSGIPGNYLATICLKRYLS